MKKSEKYFSAILMLVAVFFLVGSLSITSLSQLSLTSPGGYPVFIALLGMAFGLWVLVEGRQQRKENTSEEAEERAASRDVLVVIGLLALYIVGILLVHYIPSTLIFLFLLVYYLRRGDWKTAALISYISTFMIVLVFKYLFNVILP